MRTTTRLQLTLAIALLLLVPTAAIAREGNCESAGGRPAFGVGVTGLTVNSISPSGLGASGHVEVSVAPTWSVRAEGSAARPDANDVLVSPDGAPRTSYPGKVLEQELLVGAVHQVSPPEARGCVYGAVLAGMYRYSYGDLRLRAPGYAVMIGVGGRTGGTLPYLEARLATIATSGAPPMPASWSFHLAVTAGLRRRW